MCQLCEKNPVYEFTNKRKLCSSCFIRYFQKKFFYTIKKFSLVNQKDIVGYSDEKDFRSVVLRDNLEIYSKKSFIKLVKLSSKFKSSKKAINTTLDLTSYELIEQLIKKRKLNKELLSPSYKNIIKPLYLFLDKEVFLYAKLKKLKFNNKEAKKTKWNLFLDELEIKHPEIKRAMINSYLDISEN